MSDTPKTDALREVIVGQYKEDELTGDGMGNILSALTDIETLERERDAERALAERRGRLYDTAIRQLKELQAQVDELKRERDEAREECSQYRGMLIRLHNDLFVHHGGQAVREFKELFREENYN